MDVFAFAPVAHAYHGGPGFGGFLMFLLWIAVIFFVVRFFVLRDHRAKGGDPAAQDRANDVLAERFARGEIDSEEFQARSQTLREHRSHKPSPVERFRDKVVDRSAHSILAERYARGEIDADEYRERSRNLDV